LGVLLGISVSGGERIYDVIGENGGRWLMDKWIKG
jgi:hypothetical protein